MRRLFCLLTALALLLPMTVFAQAQLAVSDGKVQPGETVYLTVFLPQAVECTTLGVSSSYDAALLQPVEKESKWQVNGLLSDFNEKGMGVWTTNSTVELKGDIVVLAFKTLTQQPFSTQVEVSLIVKNNGQELGTFTAKATISQEQAVQTPPSTTPKTQPTEQTAVVTEAAPEDSQATAFYSESNDLTEATQPQKTEQPQADNSWTFWLLGIAAVCAVAAFVILRKKKT